mgnify:CR=1 FL=1
MKCLFFFITYKTNKKLRSRKRFINQQSFDTTTTFKDAPIRDSTPHSPTKITSTLQTANRITYRRNAINVTVKTMQSGVTSTCHRELHIYCFWSRLLFLTCHLDKRANTSRFGREQIHRTSCRLKVSVSSGEARFRFHVRKWYKFNWKMTGVSCERLACGLLNNATRNVHNVGDFIEKNNFIVIETTFI